MHCKGPAGCCLQVKRLYETFHEPFKKTMRLGPLQFSPTQAAAESQGTQQASHAAEGALAASAMAVPMESALEDPVEDHIDEGLQFL